MISSTFPRLRRVLIVLTLVAAPAWDVLSAQEAERVVADIDAIVKEVRFEGWQNTHAGERDVKKALRKTLFRYRLHQDRELFDKAYMYIRTYY